MKKVGILESDWNYTSSLPKPAAAPRVGRKKSATISRFLGNRYRKSQCWDNEDSVALEEGGYYVEISRFKIIDRTKVKVNDQSPAMHQSPRKIKMVEEKRVLDATQLQSILDGLKVCGYDLKNVYGVKTSLISKLKKSSGNWINVMDMARIKLPKFLATFNTSQHIYNAQALRDMETKLGRLMTLFRSVKDIISPDSEVHNVFKKLSSLKLSAIYEKKCTTLRQAYFDLFDSFYSGKAIENGVVDYAMSIRKRYDLLCEVNRWARISDEHVALYIDAVDNKEKV
jgi:hypothetical protein